ncbi:MAG: FtsH protease activity modulator HflK [Planctomycetaceae bacterium]|nr:FtsH protease activity modulator HflK [Planctomycetaceae bacterium]
MMSIFEGYERPRHREGVPWDQVGKWVWIALVVAVALLALRVCSSVVYRVDASDEGVVLRFGRIVETVRPGLHWKLPWPIDEVHKVPVQRIQTLEFGFETELAGRVTQYAPANAANLEVAEMLTGDLNLGHVEWIVQYRAKNPEDYLFKIGATEDISAESLPSGVEKEANAAVPDTIRDVSESVVRKLVGDVSIDYVLTIGRDQIADSAEKMIQAELDAFEAGVDIVTVKLQTTSPPTERVQDAFQEVNRARQEKERVVNEAEGEQNSKIPAARGMKDKAISEAEGYKSRVVLETTGKINAFLAQLEEYEEAKEVTRKRLYLEAMEEVLSGVGRKTIIDESVRGMVPLLNLDAEPSTGKKGAGQ